ncbi:MAG TPA: glycosyltransferase, partial [Chitinophagaceae bacterium]|nr:glycosyltransferase [Chitinophagaceae bacterium]
MQQIFIIGPAHPLRGGLATFNQRLAKEFISEGARCEIVSFSLQYPSLFFPGKTQYSTDAPPEDLIIHSIINSIDPFNWVKVGRWLRNKNPDIVVVRFWIPFMAPALGTILRQVRKNKSTKIICIADNIIPHEHRPGDRTFTRYFLKSCDAFITMSSKVFNDLRKFDQHKPAQIVQHPLYDNFGSKVSKEEARVYLNLNSKEKIILFFGFIRKYKGLDLLLQAMNDERIRQAKIKLLIAGEFYEDEKPYLEIIKGNRLENNVILKNIFIPDAEVKNYLCAADVVIQPYRNATQSGVTPLAYHFEKPMIVTNVGGLASLVPHGKAGLVCEPMPASIANAILQFYQLSEDYFIPHLRNEKQKYSWGNLTKAIFELAE